MKIELTYDEYETFNEVFVAGQIYIGLGENNPYDARNKKGYKMKKSDTRKFKRAIDLYNKFHKSCKFIEENNEKI